MKARKTVLAFILVLALILSLGVSAFAAKGSKAAYATTAAFLKELDKEDIEYTNNGIDEDEDEYISFTLSGDNMDRIDFDIYFDKDLDKVSMYVWKVIEYDERDFNDVLELVNDLNSDYIYVRFWVNTDFNVVTAEVNVPLRDCKEAGELAMDAFDALYYITDMTYPELEFYAK